MAIFGVAIGLSAFLLFWVEPLVGQLVLPIFGGSPAVWATVLVFFQGAVLLGYLYSHASVTRLGVRRGAAVHIVLAALAFAWLALVPFRQADLRASDLPSALDVLRILIAGIGLPVVVLTATTPLISAWFAATRRTRTVAEGGDPDGDPYGLYALSNAASLAALLAYPLILGRLVGLSRQVELWTLAFLGLGIVLAVTVATVLRRPAGSVVEVPTEGSAAVAGMAPAGTAPVEAAALAPDEAVASAPLEAAAGADGGAGEAVGWGRRLKWVLLAAIPSGLLAAVTNFIAADLIAAPLLWVGPLAVYLASFIVAFSARGRRLVPFAVVLAPAAITLLWTPIGSAGGWPILPLVLLEWSGLAIIATALHGRLAEDRPAPARLTEFYLVQSAGGVIGGAFVAVLSPLAFNGVWEYPALLVGALVALAITAPRRAAKARAARDPGAVASATPRSARRPLNLRPFFAGGGARLVPFVVVAGVLTAIMALERSIATPVAVRWFGVGALILLVGAQPRFLAVATGLVLAIATFVLPAPALLRDRSFFGVTEVVPTADGRWIQLMNGTTVHGVQSTEARLRQTPTFYYARSGPLGDIFDVLGRSRPDADIAVAGLGAGGIAAYIQPANTMTFFEIDPVVIEVASDPRYFTFLADAPTTPRIVLGDARLSLRDEPEASYDLVILDAFSSDAPPAHLLTVEALLEDRRVLRPGGILMIHVSNRYFDLAPALGAAGARLEMTVLERRYSPTPEDAAEAGASPSIWVVATADPAILEELRLAGWHDTDHAGVEPLTDDHPDVLRFLIGG
jgi:SAM-dependent methyltransferase